jgi:predicted transglutaminase-like cysteine proteinase
VTFTLPFFGFAALRFIAAGSKLGSRGCWGGLQAMGMVWALWGGQSCRAFDLQTMQSAAQLQGPQAVSGVQALKAVLAQAATETDQVKLSLINDFFNRRIVFASDLEVWGETDHWASPLETLGKGQGDCEDYVLGKYFSLVAAGMPESKLRLVYVRAMLGGVGGEIQAHMVLAYDATGALEPLIVDNLINEIRPASRRPDLVPVFSFNAEGLWQGASAQSAGNPVARLSRWREVLAKARAEGF